MWVGDDENNSHNDDRRITKSVWKSESSNEKTNS